MLNDTLNFHTTYMCSVNKQKNLQILPSSQFKTSHISLNQVFFFLPHKITPFVKQFVKDQLSFTYQCLNTLLHTYRFMESTLFKYFLFCKTVFSSLNRNSKKKTRKKNVSVCRSRLYFSINRFTITHQK